MVTKKKAKIHKKPAARKPAKKAAPKKEMIMAKGAKPAKKLVGAVVHFFDKISVAVIQVKSDIKVGDVITIEGPQTNLKQKVNSMQVEHKSVTTAHKGDDIGMKVSGAVRNKDLVYKA